MKDVQTLAQACFSNLLSFLQIKLQLFELNYYLSARLSVCLSINISIYLSISINSIVILVCKDS